jgi:uncharacterized NAD(P)/FAD-binding protein YdhS
MNVFDVAIVGGGFAGTAVAVGLARQARGPLRIVIIDRAGAFGRGAAYSPRYDHALLNVRARAMGAFPGDEGDFVRWLRDVGYHNDDAELGHRFVPRRIFGDYLGHLLDVSCTGTTQIERRVADVDDIVPGPDGYRLRHAGQHGSAEEIARTTSVVLALGNLPPRGFGDAALVDALRAHARNPWELLAGEQIDRAADVTIIGTGLSALDIVNALADNAHRGRIMMISRHARFPLPHAAHGVMADPLPALSGSPAAVVRTVRRLVRDASAAGQPWQHVIDALRGQTNTVWAHWTLAERRQFERHLGALWSVHRHRAPESTLAVLDALRASGQLTIARGDIRRVVRTNDTLTIDYDDRAHRSRRIIESDVLVDCSGPRKSIVDGGEPLIAALFARRLAMPEPLGMGIATTSNGALVGGAGLYALGPLRKGDLAESTAVREIRVQAREVVDAIIAAADGAVPLAGAAHLGSDPENDLSTPTHVRSSS